MKNIIVDGKSYSKSSKYIGEGVSVWEIVENKDENIYEERYFLRNISTLETKNINVIKYLKKMEDEENIESVLTYEEALNVIKSIIVTNRDLEFHENYLNLFNAFDLIITKEEDTISIGVKQKT